MSSTDNVVMKGFVSKQAGAKWKGWKKRYMVLREDSLKYYDKPMGKELGEVPLKEIQKVAVDPYVSPLCFQLVTPGRVWTLIADNEKDLNDWMTAIERTVKLVLSKRVHSTDPTHGKKEKEGWLKKQGNRFKSWKRRWFVLNQNYLLYFDKPEDEKPLGYVMVRDITSVTQTGGKSNEFNFTIVTRGRDYEIVADNEADMNSWMTAIKMVKNQGKMVKSAKYGRDTIWWCARQGKEDEVRDFLDKGTDPNVEVEKLTPMHACCDKGHENVALLLLERGGNVNALNQNEETPLHLASRSGFGRLAEVLIEHGAEVNAISTQGHTPLHFAARSQHDAVVEALLAAGAELDIKDENGCTALHNAVVSGAERITDMLLAMGARPNKRDTSGNTALHKACQGGLVDMVTILLRNRARVDARNLDGNTAMHVAARQGDDQICRVLILAGAKLDARNAIGLTPLHCALESGNEVCVTLLTECGADPLATTVTGLSMLHLALEHVNEDFFYRYAVFLVEEGANVNSVNDKGMTPLHIAVSKGNDRMAAYLLNHHSEVNQPSGSVQMQPLHIACHSGDQRLLFLMLVHGADLNAKDKKGMTPLHYASLMGFENLVEQLLDEGALLNITDNKNQTPLNYAWKKKHNSIAEMLVSSGGKVGEDVDESEANMVTGFDGVDTSDMGAGNSSGSSSSSSSGGVGSGSTGGSSTSGSAGGSSGGSGGNNNLAQQLQRGRSSSSLASNNSSPTSSPNIGRAHAGSGSGQTPRSNERKPVKKSYYDDDDDDDYEAMRAAALAAIK